jgi:hypothetical protein
VCGSEMVMGMALHSGPASPHKHACPDRGGSRTASLISRFAPSQNYDLTEASRGKVGTLPAATSEGRARA